MTTLGNKSRGSATGRGWAPWKRRCAPLAAANHRRRRGPLLRHRRAGTVRRAVRRHPGLDPPRSSPRSRSCWRTWEPRCRGLAAPGPPAR